MEKNKERSVWLTFDPNLTFIHYPKVMQTTILSTAKNFLEEFNLNYTIHQEDLCNITLVATEVTLECSDVPIHIIINPDTEIVNLVAYYPIYIPNNKRNNIGEFILRANNDILSGGFNLDFNDGEISFQTSFYFDFSKSKIRDMLGRSLNMSLNYIEKYLPGILSVSYGNFGAKEAISHLEFSTNPRLN